MSREISQIGKNIRKLMKQKRLSQDRLSSPCEINMFYVYVLQSEKDKKLYTGFTYDLKEWGIMSRGKGKHFPLDKF